MSANTNANRATVRGGGAITTTVVLLWASGRRPARLDAKSVGRNRIAPRAASDGQPMQANGPDITIRDWRPDDAWGVLRVKCAAVHETAAAHYDELIRRDWAPQVTAEGVARYLQSDARRQEATLVAVLDAAVVGFASIVAPLSELQAVYVSPHVGQQGVGSRLLASVEELALRHGIQQLRLHSSLNAVPFYRARGYVAEGHAEHTLSTGRTMACVPMRKTLTPRSA